MKDFKYDYTIHPDNSPKKFKEACKTIEEHCKNIVKDELLIDVDGSTVQPYHQNKKTIVVYDDYDVGAVYVKAEMDLGTMFN